MEKVLLSGKLGSLSASESDGVVALTGSLSASLGGGAAAGVVSVSSSNTVQVPLPLLSNLGLDLAAEKLPALASEINALKALLNAEWAKL
jgi:hypothetical protein